MNWYGTATVKNRSSSVLPGGKGGSNICYDPASQFYNKIRHTPRDVLDPQLKQQYLTDLFTNTNPTVASENEVIGDSLSLCLRFDQWVGRSLSKSYSEVSRRIFL